MLNLRLMLSVTAALGSAVIAAGCSSSSDASLHVHNNSSFSIVELHVAPVGTVNWGPDLLNGDALAPGTSVVVDVSCDTYDALLVDETGVDCQIMGIDLCGNRSDWVIHDDACTVFGAAKAARDAAAAGQPAGAAPAPDATR